MGRVNGHRTRRVHPVEAHKSSGSWRTTSPYGCDSIHVWKTIRSSNLFAPLLDAIMAARIYDPRPGAVARLLSRVQDAIPATMDRKWAVPTLLRAVADCPQADWDAVVDRVGRELKAAPDGKEVSRLTVLLQALHHQPGPFFQACDLLDDTYAHGNRAERFAVIRRFLDGPASMEKCLQAAQAFMSCPQQEFAARKNALTQLRTSIGTWEHTCWMVDQLTKLHADAASTEPLSLALSRFSTKYQVTHAMDASLACALPQLAPFGGTPSMLGQLSDEDTSGVRTYEVDEQGRAHRVKQVQPTLRPDDLKPLPSLHYVTKAEIAEAFKSAGERRRRELQNLAESPPNSRVMPEDGSVQVSAYHMSLGGRSNPKSFAQHHLDTLIGAMGRIGEREGFRVIVADSALPADQPRDEEAQGSNITRVEHAGARDPFAEDQGELSIDGNISVPVRVQDYNLMSDAQVRGRVQRFYGLEAPYDLTGDALDREMRRKFPLIEFWDHGHVDVNNLQENYVALGASMGVNVRENFTYLEGGNVIPGTLPNGEGFALVGRDSLAISKSVLERDLGRPVKHEEVIVAAAKDLGVKPEYVYPVEQPGDYHIDMHMSLIGPGRVLLNDSREAARLTVQWAREDHAAERPRKPAPGANVADWMRYSSELDRWRARTEEFEGMYKAFLYDIERRAGYEARTQADLEAAGLRVERAATVFRFPYDDEGYLKPYMNFSNCEQGLNKKGERYMIFLGGDPRAEAYLVNKLTQDLAVEVKRIHFLPEVASYQMLVNAAAGINCLAKPRSV